VIASSVLIHYKEIIIMFQGANPTNP
jgi:hypothetical protein